MGKTATKGNKDLPKKERGRQITIYVPSAEYENARRMVALGIVPSLSSLWLKGYQSSAAQASPEVRRREAEELRHKADELDALDARMTAQASAYDLARSDVLSVYSERRKKILIALPESEYRSKQLGWIEGRFPEISASFPEVKSAEDAYTILENLVKVSV